MSLVQVMGVSCVVIFQLREALRAACKSLNQGYPNIIAQPFANETNSFAFVEYESRRDADDAYHEMHNKRLGRDDVLKIEV
jgi:hypothetical protein